MSLQVEIRHRQGDFTLDVAFHAPRGVTALFGRSGAGKSTVLNVVSGLLQPDQARITLDGAALERLAPHARRIGYVFQEARLFPHLSVAGNLDYGARYAQGAAGGIARDEVIALLGLETLLARRPAALSGGEAQRVALGRALLAQPRLLLMDEPLASLDAPRKAEILPYLEALKARAGLPILYVSHAMDEVARLADTLVLMRGGTVTAAGRLQDVLADPAAVPLVGVRDAGAVLDGVVQGQRDGLAQIAVGDALLHLPGVTAAPGARVRVRVLAQDVILARTRPTGISAQNVLHVTIRSVQMGDGPGAAVALDLSGALLLARVTARAVRELELREGMACFAVLKATSVAPMSIGS
ncbi:MAG: molybdenum ABC transporter ATP-binding protein [Pseudomonadota bacterium]